MKAILCATHFHGPKNRIRYLSILILLFITPFANASKYYWVGNSGLWSDVNHWASTSGGAPLAYIQPPLQTDTVYIDQNSFTLPAQTITIDIAAVCSEFNATGATNTFSGVNGFAITMSSPRLDVFGHFILAPNMRSVFGTFRFLGTYAYNLDFKNNAITGNVILDGPGSTYSLLSPFTGGANFYVARGVFTSNNNTISVGTIFIGNPGNTRGLVLGTSVVNLSGSFVSAATLAADPQLTLNMGSSVFNFNGASPTIALQDYTFNTININSPANPSLTASSVTRATIKDLVFNKGNKVSLYGLMAITNSMVLLPGGSYIFNADINFSGTASFTANGTCVKKIELTLGTLSKTGGWTGATITNCIVSTVQFTGGGNITATQSGDGGSNAGINFGAAPPVNYYWVGGTGVWNDGLHWANTPGGVPTGCVPGPTDNVFFDSYSFTAAGQEVRINDSSNAWCANMNWTGASNHPTFKYVNTPFNGTQLYILGSLTEIPNMNWNVNSPVNFRGNGTITSAGHSFLDSVNVYTNTGSYVLGDALSANGLVWVGAGGFNSNNKPISCYRLATSVSNVQFGTSTISIYNMTANAALIPISITGNALTGFSQCTINIIASTPGFVHSYTLPSSTTFHKLVVENPSKYPVGATIGFGGSNNIFDTLAFQDGVRIITPNHTINQTLQLGSGIFTFTAGYTTTFQPAATISRFGAPGCTNVARLQTTVAGGGAGFSKASGSLTIDYATLTDIKGVGGASFSATNTVDLGGNTGWTISNAGGGPRTLYWVGNSGLWNNTANWSLTSGGTAGECAPTLKDSVVFDASSFSMAGQTVTLDVANAACKGMSWAGVTNTPSFAGIAANSISIYGSLILSSNMNVTLTSTIAFTGTGNHIIQTSGKALPTVVISAPGAVYGLADDYITNSGSAFVINSGTFNTNSKTLSTRNMIMNGGQLNLGASVWTLTGSEAYGRCWAAPANSVNAGTSIIKPTYAPAFIFDGGANNVYNIVDAGVIRTSFYGSSYKVIRTSAAVGAVFYGINILDSLLLKPGGAYYFGANTINTFADTAVLSAIGATNLPINIESTVAGMQFTLQKNTGLVCADFLSLLDSKTTGTSIFTAGANSADKGNNTGWDWTPYPAAGNGSLVAGVSCATGHALRFNITSGAFPMDIIVRNMNTGKQDTLFNVTSSPVYFMVSPLVTNQYQVQKMIVNRCTQVVTGPFNTVTVTVPTGSAGQWTNANGTYDWFDCANWGNGVVPDKNTNVTLPSSSQCNITGQGAECNHLTVNSGSLLLFNSANSALSVYGNISNTGTINSYLGRFELAGSATQIIPSNMTAFDTLAINNQSSGGVSISLSNVTVYRALVLKTGKLNTGGSSVVVASNHPASVTGYSAASYVNGNLVRAVSSNGSYAFPVGNNTRYELSTITLNNLINVNQITGKFTAFASIPTDTVISPIANYLVTGEFSRGLLDQGYWSFTPNAAPTGGDYTVTLRATGYTNPATQQFRYILVKRDAATGMKWDINQGYNDPSLHTESGGVVTAIRSSYTSFSDYAIAKLEPLSALATQLISFNGAHTQQGNRIAWTTASEQGQTNFIIERSRDGFNYEQCETINSHHIDGYGSYSYTDTKAADGDYFYRLKIVLPDGTSYYSKSINLKGTKERIITIVATEGSELVKIMVSGMSAGENLVFNLADASGRLLRSKKIQAGSNEVSMHGLPQGVYIGQVTSNKYPSFVKRILYGKR